MWMLEEEVQRKQAAKYMVAVSTDIAEPMEEEQEEEEVESKEEKGLEKSEEEGSSTKKLAPVTKQAAILWVALSAVPEFWASELGSKDAGCALAIS